jgi:GT2 family glycosyltransferase
MKGIIVLPRVNIVIVNWNGYLDTRECIASLQKINYKNYEIVLVDNGSTIDNFSEFENTLANFKLLRSEKNLGFSGGNNIGINYALANNADYILLLNNDTTVKPDFLEPLLKKFLGGKDIGIVAPMINYYDEPQRVWTVGGRISKIRGSGFADSNKLESKITYTDKEVDFVSGCCMLVKREVFHNVGLFDENYFLYVEDTDFCYRVIKFGYKIYLSPKAKIFHKVHKSSRANFASLPLYYTTRNRLYFSRKHFVQYYPFTFLYISSTMLIKSMYWLLVGRKKNILVVLRAFHDFLAGNMGMTKHDFSVKYFF